MMLYNLKKKLILHLKFANIYIYIEDIFVPNLYYSNLLCDDKTIIQRSTSYQ